MQTPSHYTHTKIEPIKVINSIELGFNLGNAYKYLARAGYKGSKKQDIKKAIDYIGFEIEQQTFFCDTDKFYLLNDFREIEADNELLNLLLSAIIKSYLLGKNESLNYLTMELSIIENDLYESAETPTTKD